jgi:excisionase family DNA binding protein
MEKLLLRPAEAAEALGIGRSRLYELLANGELPVVVIGRFKRIPTQALQRWVSDRSITASGTEEVPGHLGGDRDAG